MNDQRHTIGMIGLGVMGRNLALNMADQGFAVAGYDRDPSKVAALRREAEGRSVFAADTLEAFVASLRPPRSVMMMVPAGDPVDAVIEALTPYLAAGDLLIDGGNSYFRDTDRRSRALAEAGLHFLGMGVSGGEEGARHGPSLMPGGPRAAYARIRPLLEATAAQVEGEPCVAYLGPDAAGHYVKMVHNGIEYGLMQLIAEAYDLMKRGLGLDNGALHAVFHRWNEGAMRSFLLQITADIFRQPDEETGEALIDVIVDRARQKGTGLWSSQEALALKVPTPTINAAVAARDLSGYKAQRVAAAARVTGPMARIDAEEERFVERLGKALSAATVLTYAQGFALLGQASATYGYGLHLDEVARIWRGGCIIRAELLGDFRAAFHASAGDQALLLPPRLAAHVMSRQADLRSVVAGAAQHGLPVPAFMASLAYFDGLRSAWLPANLIQAQRDYFGAHTYERYDREGTFHTQWRRQER